MAVLFTRADLLADISDRELTALTAKLIHAGDADPVSHAIARAHATVELYCARHALDANTEKGFLRNLTLYHLYSRLIDPPPPTRLTAYEQTLRELRDVRDGKYPNFPLQTTLDLSAAGDTEGDWGSAPKIPDN